MQRTTLTRSSTIPATLRYGSSDPSPTYVIAELRADSEVWGLIRWPARKPTLEEIYWIAGLFEGEGSLCRGQVSIPQKEREILDHVRRLLGGGVGGPYVKTDRRTGKHTSHFVWYATGPRARSIARTLYHLLSTRRQAQARAYLRISRDEAPPNLDPADPTRLLWDWAPAEELE